MTKPHLRAARALIVDDSDIDVTIIRETFNNSQVRMEMEHATSAESALMILGAGFKPDIIFIDRRLNNPGLTGDELAERLINNPLYNGTIIAIMSAGYLTAEDESKFASMKIDFFFDKPLIPEQVIGMVKRTHKLWLDIMVRVDEPEQVAA